MVGILGNDVDLLTIVAIALGGKVAFDEYKDANPDTQERLKYGVVTGLITGAVAGKYGPEIAENATNFMKDPQYEAIRKTIGVGVGTGVGGGIVYKMLNNPISKPQTNSQMNYTTVDSTTQNNP